MTTTSIATSLPIEKPVLISFSRPVTLISPHFGRHATAWAQFGSTKSADALEVLFVSPPYTDVIESVRRTALPALASAVPSEGLVPFDRSTTRTLPVVVLEGTIAVEVTVCPAVTRFIFTPEDVELIT
jgi:hypothetical protein